MLNDKTKLLGMTQRRFVEAYIPGLNETVRFRSMSADEQLALQDSKTNLEARIRPIIQTVCNDEGYLLYSDDDLEALSKVDGKIIDTMLDVINELCANREPVSKLVARSKKNCEPISSDLLPTA